MSRRGGRGLHDSMVVSYANEIRRRDRPGAPDISVKWGARWLTAQQANGLFIKKIKSIEAKRQAAFDRPSIEIWFEELHKTIVENGIQSDDILNFDETGYRIGVAGDHEIVTFHPDRRNTLPNDTLADGRHLHGLNRGSSYYRPLLTKRTDHFR